MGVARKSLEVVQRRARVANMVLAGLGSLDIADRLRVSVRTVQKDLDAVTENWRSRARISYGQSIAEEIARLDSVEHAARRAWRKGGDAAMLRIVVDCVKHRSTLLGLEQTRRVEISGPGGAPVAVGFEELSDEQLQRIAAGGGSGVAGEESGAG